MPVETRINIPFIPQEGTTNSILQAIQLANEHHIQQQQLALQQQALPSEIAQRQAQTGLTTAQAGAIPSEIALRGAQAAAEQAQTQLANINAQLAQAKGPAEIGLLNAQKSLAEANLKKIGAQLNYFGIGSTAGPTLPNAQGAPLSGVDAEMNTVKQSLGKLDPTEQAILDAAEQQAKFEVNPAPLTQAVNDVMGNRRAKEMAKLYASYRGDIYNKEYYDTKTGQLTQLTANQFLDSSDKEPGRYIGYSGTVQNTLKAQSLVNDINDGIKQMRSAISDPNFQLSSTGRALLLEASERPENFARAVISGKAAEALSPQERNYFMAMATLDERAMAMRGLQGQGAGSDAQREAIVNMLPGIASADPKMANQQLDIFQNNVDNLNKMIPKIGPSSKVSAGQEKNPAATSAPDFIFDPKTGTLKPAGQ